MIFATERLVGVVRRLAMTPLGHTDGYYDETLELFVTGAGYSR